MKYKNGTEHDAKFIKQNQDFLKGNAFQTYLERSQYHSYNLR